MTAQSAPEAVVIGAGVGGLAVAIRLRHAGHRVTVLERNDQVGGKVATLDLDGYRFDLGPSLLTLPDVFDELFRLAGTSIDEQLDLVRLDPQFVYRWSDGSTLTVPDDHEATVDAFERLAPGAGEAWRSFDDHGRRIWEVATRTFFAGPMSAPWSLLRRMRSPFDLTTIDPMRTLDAAARSFFDDERLQQWVGRYATYSGSSPYAAPATLSCIPHIEAAHGCWYPRGGLGTVVDALERTAVRLGVDIRTKADVVSVTTAADGVVNGVRLRDGTTIEASTVVSNADAEHLYSTLLPDDRALRRVRRAERSTSGFVLCVGVRGHTAGLHHHNLWFPADRRAEFDAIADGRLADDPTIYACVSSVTDPTQAPAGCENWFLLVNTPPGVEVDTQRYGDLVLARLAERGVDLRSRVEVRSTLTPSDLEARTRAPGGAIYGSSSNGRRAAFVRPANRGVRPGLYLVGGSSHPGGGLPLVATSARIVADLVEEDRRS